MMEEAEAMEESRPEVRIVTAEELYQIYLNKALEPKEGQKVRVMVNMIQSLDGVINIRQDEGDRATQEGLSHPVDQNLMRYIRFHADATLNGSETLMVSGADSAIDQQKYPNLVARRKELGKAQNPIACVVTRDPDPARFDDEVLKGQFFQDTSFISILFVGEGVAQERLERIEAAIPEGKKLEIIKVQLDARGFPDVKVLADVLHDQYGVKTILSEGGGKLNDSLLAAELVTDQFLTIALKVSGKDKDSKGIYETDKARTRDNLVRLKPVSMLYEPTSNLLYTHQQVEF